MNKYNGKKNYAIKKQFDDSIGKSIPTTPGIYLWTRYDNVINKTYFYVGQSINLRNRRFDYYKIQTGLSYPTRHFEASLKAHKDWKYEIIEMCREQELDEKEKYGITHYMCKDNYITRNDSLTGSDITKTNANRIGKIKKEYEEAIRKCVKNLDISKQSNVIRFSIKLNKDGSLNKKSENAFNTLIERLGIKNEI